MSAVAIQARLHMTRSTGTYVTFSTLRKEAPLISPSEGTQATWANLGGCRVDTPRGHTGFPACRGP